MLRAEWRAHRGMMAQGGGMQIGNGLAYKAEHSGMVTLRSCINVQASREPPLHFLLCTLS